jgi:hypothetical protein
MVMLAMLFIAEQRAAHQATLALLSPRDIVDMLKEALARKPEGKHVLAARINQRHALRQALSRRASDPSQDGLPPREIIPYRATLPNYSGSADTGST